MKLHLATLVLVVAPFAIAQPPGPGPGRSGERRDHDGHGVRPEDALERRTLELRDQIKAADDLLTEIKAKRIVAIEGHGRERDEANASVKALLDRLVDATKRAEELAVTIREEERTARAREEVLRREERERAAFSSRDEQLRSEREERERREREEAAARLDRLNLALARTAVCKAIMLQLLEDPQGGKWTIRQGKVEVRVFQDHTFAKWDEACDLMANTIKVRFKHGSSLEFGVHDGDNHKPVAEMQGRFVAALTDAFNVDAKSSQLGELIKWGKETSYHLPGSAEITPVFAGTELKRK